MREGIESAVHKTDVAVGEFRTDEPFSSLFSTTRDVLFSPRQFFDGLPPDRPLGGSVTYFLICSATTAVINTVATLAFLTVPAGMALATGSIEAGMLVRILAIFVLAPLVVLPVLFVAGFFASVPIQHLFILLVAGGGIRRVYPPPCASPAARWARPWRWPGYPWPASLPFSTASTCMRRA